MKKIVFAILSVTACVAVLAQSPAAVWGDAELPRRMLRPYASIAEAAANADGESRYIVPITEWTREESAGKTSFTCEFVYPAAWLNRQILLRIESASAGFEVEVGGSKAGSVTNGAVPAEFNLTKFSKPGINKLTVTVNAPASNEPLLRGDVTWLGKAEIVSQPTVRVRDVESRTTLNDAGDGIFEVAIAVKSEALNTKQARISYELADSAKVLVAGYKDVTLSMRGEDTVRLVAIVPRERLWSAENPSLLTLTVRNRIEGRYVENIAVAVGARQTGYDGTTLKINGEPVTLKAKRVSPNMSAEDLAGLKAAGYNAVKVEAGDAASGLYDACDSAGLYVIAQLAVDTSNGGRSIKRGGNPSNEPSLTEEYLARTQALFHTSKSHPSTVAFSLGGGIANGINTYESYLLLKRLDGSRPVIYDGAGKEWNNDRLGLSVK